MRTALVGGASKGIGLGCAEALAAEGHRVIMCARNVVDLDAAVRSLRQSAREEVVGIPCDWSKPDAIEAITYEVGRREINIDILVNNVGGPPPGTVLEVSEPQWEDGLDLLFRSTLRVYRMVLPGMRGRKWGRIVNILSTTVTEPSPALAVSSVIRAALATYAKLVAWEVASDGVTVNSLMPNGFRTARTDGLLADAARRQNVTLECLRKQIEEKIPIRRLMEPAEIGALVAFLTSERASGMTGTLLPFDGGQLRCT